MLAVRMPVFLSDVNFVGGHLIDAFRFEVFRELEIWYLFDSLVVAS